MDAAYFGHVSLLFVLLQHSANPDLDKLLEAQQGAESKVRQEAAAEAA